MPITTESVYPMAQETLPGSDDVTFRKLKCDAGLVEARFCGETKIGGVGEERSG
jgi:hypothetical protein